MGRTFLFSIKLLFISVFLFSVVHAQDGNDVDWSLFQIEIIEHFNAPSDDPQVLREFIGDGWLEFLTEENPIWNTEISNGLYKWSNQVDEKAVTFIRRDKDISNSPVSVEVEFDSIDNLTALSGAGLLYRYNDTPKSYYSFLIMGNGQLQFIKRDSEGSFNTLYSSATNLVDPSQSNKLGIIGDKLSIELYLNDTFLTSIQEEGLLEQGSTGIIAISRGDFSFDNFIVYNPEQKVKKRFVEDLVFTSIKPDIYEVGEIIIAELETHVNVASRFARVDLWVAIELPTGEVFYKTPFPLQPFSPEPQPFMLSLERTDTVRRVLEFEVVPGFGGDYTLYAFYVKQDKNPLTENFFLVIRSNIATTTTTLRDKVVP
ncbi:secreted protein [Beggiatoa sp. PS]|nr:secreted protein [Beggiatoa sp. PS]